jgi:hypothetical protein
MADTYASAWSLLHAIISECPLYPAPSSSTSPPCALRAVAANTAETTYYTPFANFLNVVGERP